MVERKTKQNTETKTEQPKSVHGMYYYLKQAWKHPSSERQAEQREGLAAWREADRITKIDKPTRLDRARALGYKAKKGFVIFRVTLVRGGRQRERPTTKRRPKRFNTKLILKMSYQGVAEARVQKKYPNLNVLNSYKIGKDGKFYFFEVIAVDMNAPEIKADKNLSWLCNNKNKNRALRGLTSVGKKARGLLNRGANFKVRPSSRMWFNKHK